MVLTHEKEKQWQFRADDYDPYLCRGPKCPARKQRIFLDDWEVVEERDCLCWEGIVTAVLAKPTINQQQPANKER